MNAPITPWPYPFWIAHRGAGKLAPENTLAAFRLGASHGHRAFECDVKLSRDDVPFLLHDATLDRTTPAQGVAGERDWAELAALEAGAWHSAAFAGERLPTLEALAQFILQNQFALNLEIKPTPGTEHHTGRVVGQAVLRLWANAGTPPLLSSFRPEALAGAQATAPDVPRALLLDSWWEGWPTVVQSLGCVAIVCNHRLLHARTMAELRHHVPRVLVYTVNDPSDVARMKSLGVDGIITDAVDVFSPLGNAAQSLARP